MERAQASRHTVKSKIPRSMVLAKRRSALPPNSGTQATILKDANKELCPPKTKPASAVRGKDSIKNENVRPAYKMFDSTTKAYHRRMSKSFEDVSAILRTHKKFNEMSYRELKQYCEALDEEIPSMQQTMGDMLHRISTLQEDRRDLSSQLDSCKSDLQDSRESCSVLKERNETLEQQVTGYRTLLESNSIDVLSGRPVALSAANACTEEESKTHIQSLAERFHSICEVTKDQIDVVSERTKEIHMQSMKWTE